MKKFFLSFFVISLFIAYSLRQKSEEGQVNVIAPKNITDQATTSPTATPLSSTNAPINNPTTQQPAVTFAKQKNIYKDGEFTGDVTDAFYGNIQVKAVIQNGKIIDVQFLQYPNDRSQSVEINTQAMPYLKQEAIQAQSSNVDVVSGATDSSQAFTESLQSALLKAKNV